MTFYDMGQSTDFVFTDTALLRKGSTITTKFEIYFTGKSSLSLLLIAIMMVD